MCCYPERARDKFALDSMCVCVTCRYDGWSSRERKKIRSFAREAFLSQAGEENDKSETKLTARGLIQVAWKMCFPLKISACIV